MARLVDQELDRRYHAPMAFREKRAPAELEPTRRLTVVSNREIAPGVRSLRIRREFSFAPGQVVAITVDPEISPRCYSIASGSGENEIELLYDVVETGLLTPLLARLTRGAQLFVSDPFGSFLDCGPGSWWIATGTGVAPFLSMVRSGLAEGRMLVHGSRTIGGFYHADLLLESLGGRYVRCCTNERATGVYPGRLTKWLAERPTLEPAARYMLCGSAGMVVDVRDLLITKGVPFDAILAEVYF